MTAKEYWEIMPMKNPHYKINVIEDLALEDLCELAKDGRPRKGILKQLDTIEVEPIPIEELSNPLVTMKMCDEMIHSMNCPKMVRQKFFAKKKGFCRLLMKHGCATDFVAFGEKYISFKVGNEKVMTKRKKLFAHYQPKHIADGDNIKRLL